MLRWPEIFSYYVVPCLVSELEMIKNSFRHSGSLPREFSISNESVHGIIERCAREKVHAQINTYVQSLVGWKSIPLLSIRILCLRDKSGSSGQTELSENASNIINFLLSFKKNRRYGSQRKSADAIFLWKDVLSRKGVLWKGLQELFEDFIFRGHSLIYTYYECPI